MCVCGGGDAGRGQEYRGTGPFSEPESVFLRDLATRIKVANTARAGPEPALPSPQPPRGRRGSRRAAAPPLPAIGRACASASETGRGLRATVSV